MCLCVCKRESVWETDRQAETETIYHMSMWYIYTFVSGCMHLLVRIYRGQGKTSHILLYHSICYPLRQGVSLNLKLGWHPASPSYSSISTPPHSSGLQVRVCWRLKFMSSCLNSNNLSYTFTGTCGCLLGEHKKESDPWCFRKLWATWWHGAGNQPWVL